MQNNTFIAIKKLQSRTTNENYTIQMENYRIDMKVIEYKQKIYTIYNGKDQILQTWTWH